MMATERAMVKGRKATRAFLSFDFVFIIIHLLSYTNYFLLVYVLWFKHLLYAFGLVLQGYFNNFSKFNK